MIEYKKLEELANFLEKVVDKIEMKWIDTYQKFKGVLINEEINENN